MNKEEVLESLKIMSRLGLISASVMAICAILSIIFENGVFPALFSIGLFGMFFPMFYIGVIFFSGDLAKVVTMNIFIKAGIILATAFVCWFLINMIISNIPTEFSNWREIIKYNEPYGTYLRQDQRSGTIILSCFMFASIFGIGWLVKSGPVQAQKEQK